MTKKYTAHEKELEQIKEILSRPERTIPALFFGAFDNLIGTIFRRKSPLHWLIIVVIVGVVSQLPTLLISFWEGDLRSLMDTKILYVWMGYILLGLSAIVIARVGIFYLFKNIDLYVVGKISRWED